MTAGSVTIVDYGMGNLRSVQKAFERNGARAVITSNPKDIEKAEKLVLPGVGAFHCAMRELEKRKLVRPLKEKIQSGAPYLGLCLGLQLLFDNSEESDGKNRVCGLGIVPGSVKRFRGSMKIPHMGWNNVDFKKKDCPLFKRVKSGDHFYFVHSYYAVPKDASWVLAETSYGDNFCSAIWKENIFATQFHPEKSQESGLRVINNFVKL